MILEVTWKKMSDMFLILQDSFKQCKAVRLGHTHIRFFIACLLCFQVFGATHPKTKKAYDVLHEPQYLRQAQAKGFDVPELVS